MIKLKLESSKQVKANPWTLQRLRRVERNKRIDAVLDFLAGDFVAGMIVISFFVLMFYLLF